MKITRKDFIRVAGLAALGVATGCGSSGAQIIPEPPEEHPLEEYRHLKNLFGDLHVHTVLSDGDESPDYALRYARDVTKLDFCSLSDHAETITVDGKVCMPYYRSLPAKYDEPGKFCVLYGYEWTSSRFGHRNIYSLDNQIPLLSSQDPNYMDIEDFWKGLEGYDLLTIPHHTMIPSTYAWWDFDRPDFERIAEFCSKWGYSLYQGNPRPIWKSKAEHGIYEAFKHGKHYGLIGSSDTHISRPGSRLQEARPKALPYPQPGIACVWAAGHTREAIFDALKKRRCYGSSGTSLNLQFAVNKSVMGSEIISDTPPDISFKVVSPVTITQVDILKITEADPIAIKTYTPNDFEAEDKFVDDAFIDDCGYTIKVELANSDMALASPIWVQISHGGSIV